MNRLKEDWPKNILKDAGIDEVSDKNIEMLEKTLAFANDRQNEMAKMYYKDRMSYGAIGLHHDVTSTSVKMSIDKVIRRIRRAYRAQRALEKYGAHPENIPIAHTTLSVKLQNALIRYLQREEYNKRMPKERYEFKPNLWWDSFKIRDVLELSTDELLRIKNVGAASLKELTEYLDSLGIKYDWKFDENKPNTTKIEIFWNDLTEAKKAEIREVLGLEEDDDNNWTYIPMTIMEIEKDVCDYGERKESDSND